MPSQRITIQIWRHQCGYCKRVWESKVVSVMCPKCKRRDWNAYDNDTSNDVKTAIDAKQGDSVKDYQSDDKSDDDVVVNTTSAADDVVSDDAVPAIPAVPDPDTVKPVDIENLFTAKKASIFDKFM